jgi:hypothetical protein
MGWAGTRRLQVPAVGGAGRGGGTGVGEEAPVTERAKVSERRPVSRVVRPALVLGVVNTHVGAKWLGGSKVGRDTRGPDNRAVLRSGGWSGSGEVERTAGRWGGLG